MTTPTVDIAALKTMMRSQPKLEPDSTSKRQIIKSLVPEIRAMLAKNYSFHQIADLLAQQSIKLSPNTLRNYFYQFAEPKPPKEQDTEKSTKTAKPPQPPKSSTAPAPSGAVDDAPKSIVPPIVQNEQF